MNEQEQKIFEALAKPADDAAFSLRKVQKISLPHPYCITPKHLQYADSMYLDAESIARAESKGARCGMKDCNLSFAEHENMMTVFIAVPRGVKNLNDVPGLNAYLNSVKAQAEALGVQGFAFPPKE